MEKIDLTKCVNCRFRAKVDGKEVEGRIAVEGDYLQFSYLYGRYETCYSMLISYYWEHGKVDYFDDFELVPRDPEAYRDWQVGDRVNISDTHTCWEELVEVIFRSGELVVCKDSENNATETKTCDQLYREGGRLVLTDIEQQIIEEKKKYEPQDGDICYAETKLGTQKFIIIYNHRDWSLEYGVKSDKWRLVENCSWSYSTIRPATDEEKKRLFDAMAKEGKRWNAEKKVVEDIPKPHEFRKGEPVLVRNYSDSKWRLSAFLRKSGSGDVAVSATLSERDCFTFNQCIPYNERTMHLLGTSEDYKEGE